jgi:sugar O-acyltransferase (sialic acid O-acetyltransferase NeuD family)
MKPIILIGGGGHCISCIDVVESTKKYKILGILDLPEKVGEKIINYEIIGTDNDLPQFINECSDFLITVGQITSSLVREKIFFQVKKAGGNLPVVVSPFAYISQYATVAEGTVVMHQALVNAQAKIGRGCIINTKALIEHESQIGNFTHVSTSVSINGQVKIGKNCFIGSNSVIGNNVEVTDDCVISAGTQVLKNIDVPGVYAGNPFKRRS